MLPKSAVEVGAASAGNGLQSGLVADDEPCTSVVDQLPFSQRLCDAGHARAVYAEHACHVFVRQLEFLSTASLMQRQKPAAEPLFDRVERIANYSLRQLPDLTVDVVVQSRLQSLIRDHFAFEDIAGDRQSVSGYADLHTIRRTARVERGGDPDRAFVSDYADLDGPAILEDLKFGDDGGLRKVDHIYLVILLVQVLVFIKVHSLDELSHP